MKQYLRIFGDGMCQWSEICNSYIKQTTFDTIVENLKGQIVNLEEAHGLLSRQFFPFPVNRS